MVNLSDNKWNIAAQPLKILFLCYSISYGHQIWQGGDLS